MRGGAARAFRAGGGIRAGLRPVERRLLDEAQRRFPVCARPYAELGRRLGLPEERVLRLLRRLRAGGVVRRIGPSYDARAHGLDTVLVAFSVPPGDVRRAAAAINELDGVTHNYLRRHSMNIWFTLASAGRAERRRTLRRLVRRIRPLRALELPAERLFKLGLLFDLGVGPAPGGARRRIPRARGRVPPAVARLIPFDLALAPRPFPRGTIGAVKTLAASGRVRRFGAVLDGEKLGYRYRALVAWIVPAGREAGAARALAAFDAVSHCYARPAAGGWPYRLYTMVHARDRRSGARLIAAMSRAALDGGHVVLESVETLKRASMDPCAVRRGGFKA